MERLTSREPRVSGLSGVCCTHFGGSDCQAVQGCCGDGCVWEDAAWERLAAYEDTGLEPEDLKKVFNADAVLKLAAQALKTTPAHLRELVQAEQDGRLIVLPIALNKKVWVAAPHLPAPYQSIYVNTDEILRDVANGYVFGKTREEVEAALKGGAE